MVPHDSKSDLPLGTLQPQFKTKQMVSKLQVLIHFNTSSHKSLAAFKGGSVISSRTKYSPELSSILSCMLENT